MRILCCGNSDRGDDGVGVLVATRLSELDLPATLCSGQVAELIDAWTGESEVIVVDAAVTGCPAGTVHEWEAQDVGFPTQSSASTHGLGLREAIELSRKLGTLPTRLYVYGIEAQEFSLGTRMSPAVKQAAERLAQKIAADYQAHRNGIQ